MSNPSIQWNWSWSFVQNILGVAIFIVYLKDPWSCAICVLVQSYKHQIDYKCIVGVKLHFLTTIWNIKKFDKAIVNFNFASTYWQFQLLWTSRLLDV